MVVIGVSSVCTVDKSQAGMWGSTMDRARVELLGVAAWMVG